MQVALPYLLFGTALGVVIFSRRHMSDKNGRRAAVSIATAADAVTWTYAMPRRHSVRGSCYENCITALGFVAHVFPAFVPLQTGWRRCP
uniref:Putative secreted protein n=1 Tax=Ixodes scapularis TaxID=6945 RepID=A0A4D5RBT5_IXOSC